jgi:hypothetical protein
MPTITKKNCYGQHQALNQPLFVIIPVRHTITYQFVTSFLPVKFQLCL